MYIMYYSSTRIPISKLQKFVHGSGVTISPDDVMNQANKQVRIVFGKLKDQRRMLRNFSLGKGFMLKHDQINDIEDETGGGSIFDKVFDKIKQVGKKAGEPFEKTIKVNPFTAGYDLGHDVIAPKLIRAMGRTPTGGGVRARKTAQGGKINMKKAGTKIKDAFQKLGTVLAKEGKTIAKRNKGELSALGRAVVSTAVDVASGDASKSDLKEVLKDTARQTSHLATRDALTRRGIYNEDNPYLKGQYAPQAIPMADVLPEEEIGGSVGLGGNRLLRNASVNPMSVSERMAHARSFRKHGGSMKPLGGAIRRL